MYLKTYLKRSSNNRAHSETIKNITSFKSIFKSNSLFKRPKYRLVKNEYVLPDIVQNIPQ